MRSLAVIGLLLVTSLAPSAHASFWDELGASIGYARWDAHIYTSEGLATRLRWQPVEHFGIDLTSELLATEGAGAKAFDLPVGFHLYVPFELGWGVSVRTLAGLCVDVSMARQSSPAMTASDDVRFGFRLGGGTEVELGGRFWAFADAKWERYLGHSRGVSSWSSSISGDLGVSDRLAIAIGLGMDL